MDKKGLLLLIVVFAFLLVSCRTLGSVADNVRVGMTKEEVISNCGKPSSTGFHDGKEYFIYNGLYYSDGWNDVYVDYAICFDSNGIVEGYGQYGPSKVETVQTTYVINNR